MDEDYEQHEKDQKAAEKHNNLVIADFRKYLENKSLKSTTVNKHVYNIRFYANYYLLRYEIIPVEEGALNIGYFLGDFFIRKAMWSRPSAVKGNISSFKKFYTFLNEIKMLSNEDLREMKQLIREEKDDWMEASEAYWNGSWEW